MAADAHGRDDRTGKAAGYGRPVQVTYEREGGLGRLVLRTMAGDEFGHDRRSDRAQSLLLAYDTFGQVPRHVRAIDVGAILEDGGYLSLRRAAELYLVTEYAEGVPYAEDLRRLARSPDPTPRDLARCEALASYLVTLHEKRTSEVAYRRSIRDLVGSGEGIFGVIDGYPAGVPGAAPERLERIERACVAWRWRIARLSRRLARVHGDFHPFNVLFDEETSLAVLDTSRGSLGDPADDVTCMAINYLFFAFDMDGAWTRALRPLWRKFWRTYLDATGDRELLAVAPPFFAWRGLVLANPRFYPALSPAARDVLLQLVEEVLSSDRLDPDRVEERLP